MSATAWDPRCLDEVPTETPWGPCQSVDHVRPGVASIGTAGHGGYYVAPEVNQLIPAAVKVACFPGTGLGGALEGWYEEDCDAAFPAIFVPGVASDDTARRRALCFALSYKGGLEPVRIAALAELARFDETAGKLPVGVDALRSALVSAGALSGGAS